MKLILQIRTFKKAVLLIGFVFFVQLFFAQTVNVGPTPDQYRRNADNTVEKYDGTKWNKIGDDFASIKADIVHLIGTKTNGATLIYMNGSWNSNFQTVTCHGKKYTVSADKALIYQDNPAGTVGNNVDILRSENDNLICHSQNGTVWKYNFKGPEWWTQINQIITIEGSSYYVRTNDKSIWKSDPVNNNDVKIGSDCKLLISNDNTLVCLSTNGDTYWRYTAGASNPWTNFTPKFVSTSPEATDPGFWSFIQNKSALGTNLGLTINSNNQVVMGPIPATGNCDKFLWRTQLLPDGSGRFKLINKSLGNIKALDCGLDAPSIGTLGDYSGQQWVLKKSNESIHGTNAFNMSNEYITPQKSLDFVSNKVIVAPTNSNSTSQVWIFQFAQMVSGSMLPKPSDKNTATTFNKKLSGKNGVSFYGTNTVSDWALVNTYLIINNFMNAVKDQRTLATAINGQNMVVIGKDDNNPSTYLYPIINQNNMSQAYITAYRGGSGYLQPAKAIVVTEEMMCKTGVINRAETTPTREFEQVVHEFAHAVQELCGWIPSIDANNICPNERGVSSECFCWKCQAWFNSCQSQGANQGTRDNMSQTDKAFMSTKFNATNTWMPPRKLRD